MPPAGYIDSYYRRSLVDDRAWPALDGDADAEVCVIGGGLAGHNCALGLAGRGVNLVSHSLSKDNRSATKELLKNSAVETKSV